MVEAGGRLREDESAGRNAGGGDRANQTATVLVSVSHIAEPDKFVGDYMRLYTIAQANHVPVVIGGRALTAELRTQLDFTSYCDNLRHLEVFAKTPRPNKNAQRSNSNCGFRFAICNLQQTFQ